MYPSGVLLVETVQLICAVCLPGCVTQKFGMQLPAAKRRTINVMLPASQAKTEGEFKLYVHH